MRLTIKNFTSGRNVKMFNTSAGVKLLNTHSTIYANDIVETPEGIRRKYKYDFIYPPSVGTTNVIPILQMYPVTSFQVQSSVITNNSQITPEFNEEYLHTDTSGYISIAQYNDMILAMTTDGDNILKAKSVDYDELNVEYYNTSATGYWDDKKVRTDLPVYVGVYLPEAEFNSLLPSYQEDVIAPAYLLSGVDFNYLSEINASSDYAHIDFDVANLKANTLNMKNMYNENWDVSASVTTSGYLGINRAITSAKINNTRVYSDIKVSHNNTIWAKYRHGKYYTGRVLPPIIQCDIEASYGGGEAYPSPFTLILGSNTGTVNLQYTAFNNPERFIVTYNNSTVIDTKYRGLDTYYGIGGVGRAAFISSLTGKIDPLTGSTYPFSHVDNDTDGYPIVYSPGNGTESFSKNVVSVTTALVEVYAPGAGTEWNFTLTCPIG